MLNSPNGISYYDSASGRLNPGIIDLSKFENTRIPILESSINYREDKHIGAELLVMDLNEVPLAKAYYNPETYERKAESGIEGPGGVDIVEKKIYVLAKNQNSIIPSILNLEILVERSR